MKEIVALLDSRKEALQQVRFCRFLHNKNLSPYARLSFAPSMLFFTMGFKDILHTLQEEHNPSPMQQSVNTHCEEDSFHWEWYLKDLEKISYGKAFLDLPRTQAFALIWSEENRMVREVVYQAIHLAKTYTAPFLRLIMIEALEATFDCFNGPVFDMVREMGQQEELEYFGQVHSHAEANHAMDKTIAGHQSAAYEDYQPDPEESQTARLLINEIFDAFEAVFDCWYAKALSAGN